MRLVEKIRIYIRKTWFQSLLKSPCLNVSNIHWNRDWAFGEGFAHNFRYEIALYSGACVHSNSDTYTSLKIELCGIQHSTEGEQMAQPMYYMQKS